MQVEFLVFSGDGLVTKSRPILATPWTVVPQAPLSMGFPKQDYWIPFHSPGDSSLTEPPGKPSSVQYSMSNHDTWCQIISEVLELK